MQEDDEFSYSEDMNIASTNTYVTYEQIKFITSDDVYKIIEDKIEKIKDIIQLNNDDCLLLLRCFKWNLEKLESEYFTSVEKYKELAGIECSQKQQSQDINTIKFISCPVCLEVKTQFDSLSCKQLICKDCWKDYIETHICSKSPEVFLKCPFEKCPLIVKQSFVLKYLGDNSKSIQMYRRFLGKSYCQESKTIKFCPVPGCDYVAENYDMTNFKITCKCGNDFCFRCSKEYHEPCSCKMIQEWNEKNSNESENIRWIRINTKPCPNCSRNIEKNNGCNHMTCRPPQGCGHEFCWLCLGSWSQHGEKTGGYYQCNKYNQLSEKEKQSIVNEVNKEKSLLQKYIFYYERYTNHEKVQKQLTQIYTKTMDHIESYQKQQQCDIIEFSFLLEAIKFLEKAKRCQKYTYCYGYYIEKMQLKELFEDSQGQFEKNCEILLELVEIEFPKMTKYSVTDQQFRNFKEKVNSYRSLTEKFMIQFLEFIQNEN